jgi:phosphotransferase system IIB component
MKKIKFWLLCIFSLGIFYWWIKVQAKKVSNNSSLTYAKKINFNIHEFIQVFGGEKNIISTSSSINSITINLNTHVDLNEEEIKEYKIMGINWITSTKVILIIGNNAFTISKEINEIIKKTI